MQISEIKQLALNLTHTKDAQMPDDLVLHQFFNLARKKVVRTIVSRIGESYFYDTHTLDIEANRADGKYTLPSTALNKVKFSRYKKILVKQALGADYVPATEVSADSDNFNWDDTLKNAGTPVFFITSNDLWVAPNSDVAIPAGIKITGIIACHDLNTSDPENLLMVPHDHHDTIAYVMGPLILKYRGKDELALAAKKEAEFELDKMIEEMTDRVEDDFTRRMPLEESDF